MRIIYVARVINVEYEYLNFTTYCTIIAQPYIFGISARHEAERPCHLKIIVVDGGVYFSNNAEHQKIL